VELDDGTQANGAAGVPTGRFEGGLLEGVYTFSNHWGISARYEDLNDTQGVLTGTPQVMSEFTIGPMFFQGTGSARMVTNIEHTTFHIPQFWVKAGFEVFYSTSPFYSDGQGNLQKLDTMATIQLNFLF